MRLLLTGDDRAIGPIRGRYFRGAPRDRPPATRRDGVVPLRHTPGETRRPRGILRGETAYDRVSAVVRGRAREDIRIADNLDREARRAGGAACGRGTTGHGCRARRGRRRGTDNGVPASGEREDKQQRPSRHSRTAHAHHVHPAPPHLVATTAAAHAPTHRGNLPVLRRALPTLPAYAVATSRTNVTVSPPRSTAATRQPTRSQPYHACGA